MKQIYAFCNILKDDAVRVRHGMPICRYAMPKKPARAPQHTSTSALLPRRLRAFVKSCISAVRAAMSEIHPEPPK